MPMIKEGIAKVIRGVDLQPLEAAVIMREIMQGEATGAQIASFLTALRCKGETVEEIASCAEVMRELAQPINISCRPLVDTCGTGGDGSGTFNISTTVAFVVAGAGLAVAKHGNRSVSSKSGSADLLEELGVNLKLGPEGVKKCIEEIGIGFLFAPNFHLAMKHALGPRREMGIRTIFNLLGPLTNPARAQIQVLGVYDEQLTVPLAEVLLRLGVKSAFVVHGAGGLDEFSTLGKNRVASLKEGRVSSFCLHPGDLGISAASPGQLKGGSPRKNARITFGILKGEDPGPGRDIVLLNAAAALVAGGRASDLAEGIEVAEESILSGQAMKKLQDLINLSGTLAA